MKLLDKIKRALRPDQFGHTPRARVGDIVLYFQCDGCMATDHKLQWVGQVIAIEEPKVLLGSAVKYRTARVIVLKRNHEDWRDKDLGYESFIVEDASVQKLTRGLVAIFK